MAIDVARAIGHMALLAHLPLPPAEDLPCLVWHGDEGAFKLGSRLWGIEDDSVTELAVTSLDANHQVVAWTE